MSLLPARLKMLLERRQSRPPARTPTSVRPRAALREHIFTSYSSCLDISASADKKQNKKAKRDKKKSGLDTAKPVPAGKRGSTVPSGDEDSMVAPGGPALDDDVDEHVERPKAGKKKKGAPTTASSHLGPEPR